MGGNENWQLYAHADGHLVLVAPRSVPPVHVTVDAGFTSGEVLGRFDPGGPAIYPLSGLEQVLYSNWLASHGDLMLHASGVVIDGMGHAFVGDSGAGKSTAAHSLRNMHGTTVLGEDQVVLRMIGGRFWIYGTPWHLDPQMHSPLGAPLKALYFLKRDGDSGVTPMTGSEGVAQIFSTAFVPLYNHPGVDRILHRLASLAGQVPFYAFSYDLGSDLLPLIASH